MNRKGIAWLVAVVFLVLSSVTGCGPTTDVRKAAEELMGHLEDGHWPDPTADFAEGVEHTIAPMGGARPRVRVSSVEVSSGTAKTTLGFVWDLPTGEWTYNTTLMWDQRDGTWRPVWSTDAIHPQLEDGQRLRRRTVAAERGRIVDPRGRVLAGPRPVLRLGLNKPVVADNLEEAAARRIAAVLEIDPDRFVAKVREAGEEAFVEGLVVRGMGPEFVPSEFDDIPGAAAFPDERILPVERGFADELLGQVGEATAEDIEKGRASSSAERIGRSGLQLRYDERLAGVPGDLVETIDESGQRIGDALFSSDPRDGEDLAITLDKELQTRAEAALESVEGAASLTAIRPSTGEVLVLANSPGVEGAQVANSGHFAPGSTFKVVTALALLRSGFTADTAMDCPATTVVDGRQFKNYSDFPARATGPTTLRGAIAASCNTALIDQHERLDGAKLRDAAGSLGLGIDHDLGFPAYFGSIPDPDNVVGLGESIIGQARIEASPLAMASVAASVDHGATVVPHLLVGQRPRSDARPLTDTEARALQDLMEAAVQDGSAASLQDVARGAKTGTAEYGQETPLRTHAWMIAYGDDLAIAAFVQDGDSGGATAGPLVEKLLAR